MEEVIQGEYIQQDGKNILILIPELTSQLIVYNFPIFSRLILFSLAGADHLNQK